jgi:hypothetical protein
MLKFLGFAIQCTSTSDDIKDFRSESNAEPQTRRLKRVDLDNEGLPSPIT